MEQSVSWDAPWSTDLIRSHNPWTLAGDAGMFLYLQQSGDEFKSKALEAQTAVENIYSRSTLLNKKLDNAFNDFQMLSNTQFLENRIEEELTDANQVNKPSEDKSEKPLTKEEKEEQLKVTFKECLKKSFEIFATARLGTDSEADLLFTERPSLPYTIGTEQYNNSETAGIVFPFPIPPVEVAVPNGEHTGDSNQQPADDISDDEDLFPDAARASHSNTTSEVGGSRDGESVGRGMESSGMLQDDDEEEEGDLFGTSSNSAQHQDSTPAAASNRDRNEPRTIVLSPPNLEDTDSEEDEDDDLFTIKPKRTLTVSNKDNEPASNAAGISEASSSQEPVTSRNETASSVMEQPPPIQSNANLGSDSDSDEDDLFKSFRKVTVSNDHKAEPSQSVLDSRTQKSATVSGGTAKVKFSDEESDIEDAPLHPKLTSNFMDMFESSDDESYLYNTKPSKANLFAPDASPAKNQASSSAAPNPVEKLEESVESKQDSDDDEAPKSTPIIPAGKKVISDSESDDGGFPNMTAKPNKSLGRIFGSTDDDADDELVTVKKPVKTAEVKNDATDPAAEPVASTSKQEKVAEKPPPGAAKPPSGFLDNDDDEEDLFKSFSQKKPLRKPEAVEKAKPKFSDDSDDGDLFRSGTVVPTVKTTTSKVPGVKTELAKETSKPKSSGSDSDDLFASIEKKQQQSASSEKKPVVASSSKDEKKDKDFVDPLGSQNKAAAATSAETVEAPNDFDLPPLNNEPLLRSPKKLSSQHKAETVDLPPLDMDNNQPLSSPKKNLLSPQTKALTVDLPPLDLGNDGPPPPSPKKVSSPRATGSIAARAAMVNIAALKPGQAPPSIRKLQSQTSAPAATSTGASVTEMGKDKTKLGPRRRPPSRPGRPLSSVGGSFNVSREPAIPEVVAKTAEVIQMPMPSASPISPPNSAKNDFDIFEESLSAPVAFSNKKKSDASSVPAPSVAEKKDDAVTDAAPEVDIFAENVTESPEKTKPVTGATKKKKAGGTVKSAKSKAKKTGAANKGDSSKKPDVFDTPDDIFDD